MIRCLAYLSLFCLGVTVAAAPSVGRAAARGVLGPVVRIALEGRREVGIGLHGEAQGWHIDLATEATSLVLFDETSTEREKWVVPVIGRGVRLDRSRFVGGHAYHFELHRGATVIESGFVYLYPAHGRRANRVEFGVDTDSQSRADLAIAILPKSAL